MQTMLSPRIYELAVEIDASLQLHAVSWDSFISKSRLLQRWSAAHNA